MYSFKKALIHLRMTDKHYQSQRAGTRHFLCFEASSFINSRHKIYTVRYVIIKTQSKNSSLTMPLNNYGLFTFFFHILMSALCDG